MDQFDKKIRKTLAKAPRHDPDSEVWSKIATNLTPSGQDTVGSWVRTALIAATLMATAGIFYWLGSRQGDTKELALELDKMTQTIADLQNDRNRMMEHIVDTLVIRDTVWHMYYPEQQVFQSFLINERQDLVSDQTHSDHSIEYRPAILQSATSVDHDMKQILEDNYSQLINRGRIILPSEDDATSQGPQDLTFRSIVINKWFDQLEVRAPSISSTFQRKIKLHPYRGLLADQIIKTEKSHRFWKTIMPDRIRLGALAGGLNPTLHETEHTQEWLAGIQSEFLFFPRISILTGLRYRYLHYKSEGEFEHIKFPIPNGLKPGDKLKELYATIQYFNIPVLFKYSYPITENLYPYVQAGILIGGANKQNYKYEIVRNGDELKLNGEAKGAPWIINSYLLALGMEYSPSSRITLTMDVEGRYHFTVPEVEYDQIHGLGMRLGLYYNF